LRQGRRLADELGAWDRMLASGLPEVVPEHVASAAADFGHAARPAAGLLDGEYLAHVDCRADNLLVSADGRVWVVDWPWAAVGVPVLVGAGVEDISDADWKAQVRESFENAQASKNEEDEGAKDGGERLSKRLVDVIDASSYRKADVTDADDLRV
ncbi:hypothetical protein IAE22_31070, partial [Bacillus sp. S34]|nr:hypothetical protein [Bacillus sp. S34]